MSYLQNGNVIIKEERTSAGFLASGILNGTKEYEQKDFENFDTAEKIRNNEKINEKDKENMIKILKENSEYKSFIVLSKDNEYRVVYNKENTISTMEAIKFLINSFVENPILIIKNYVTNYLATISVYNIQFEGMKINIDKKMDFINTAEIGVIGFRIFEQGIENVFPLSEEYEIYAQPYENINQPIRLINYIMKIIEIPNVFVMKIAFLLLPILTIVSFIVLCKTKNKYNKKYGRLLDIIVILFVFSFLHILIHALLGSTIDRYAIPAIATTYIGILISIYAIVYRKKYKVKYISGNNKKKEKIKNEKM